MKNNKNAKNWSPLIYYRNVYCEVNKSVDFINYSDVN